MLKSRKSSIHFDILGFICIISKLARYEEESLLSSPSGIRAILHCSEHGDYFGA